MKQLNIESYEVPKVLEVHQIGSIYFELSFKENISQSEKDGQVIYNYDETLKIVEAHNINALKVEFVRLRFTQDDEFALINKGIANPSDEEYLAYREYVNACKVVVDEYLLG